MTNWDPSMAPKGKGVAYIHLPVFPVDVNEGWAAARPVAAQAVLARASDYYEGFDAELGRWFETCPDREARTGLTRGCVTDVDFGAQRKGAKRPAFGLGGPEPPAARVLSGRRRHSSRRRRFGRPGPTGLPAGPRLPGPRSRGQVITPECNASWPPSAFMIKPET